MLVDKETAARRIASGEPLVLSGDADVLSRLPLGRWIGGSTSSFMAARGITSRDSVFVSPLPGSIESVALVNYDSVSLQTIHRDTPDCGYSMLILPYESAVHRSFAHDAPEYQQAFIKPLIGWVSGVHVDDLGKKKPCVFDGASGQAFEDAAVAVHIGLAPGQIAEVGTINLFTQGSGENLTFDEEGFDVRECRVDGKPELFSDYLTRVHADTRWPMVANYAGTQINVSFQRVDPSEKRVRLYAPVFRHVTYRLAAPLSRSYALAYADAVRGLDFPLTCSCILNFLHGALEGQPVTGARGPATFGEIAHQLLNQTTVYLEIHST